MDMSEVGKGITEINNWLDGDLPGKYLDNELAQDWARVAKIGEEYGESIEAMIGWTGQNPRKGFSSSEKELLSELADVAATAILAIQHFTGEWSDTEGILWDKLVSLRERVPEKYRL
jgi:hypothetical protein